MISVVPADVGKPTVKSDKALVRDGSCLWENAVYETVKFSRDAKTGKIHERIYYFVVGTVWNVTQMKFVPFFASKLLSKANSHFLCIRGHQKVEFLEKPQLISPIMSRRLRFPWLLFPLRTQKLKLF